MGGNKGNSKPKEQKTNDPPPTSFKQPNSKVEVKGEIKMILLGSGESGKSTVFKQIKRVNEQKFTKDELAGFRNPIFRNILIVTKSCLKSVLKRFPDKPFSLDHSKENCDYILNLMPNEEEIDEFEACRIYTKETYAAIIELWKEQNIRDVFVNYRAVDFHIFDGSDYFFNTENLVRVQSGDTYVPTEEDVLRCRKKTVGIVEMNFIFSGIRFRIVDVGGQKNERKKWEKAFSGVNVVFFVASLGDYDQLMYEDNSTNRMTEAMELFGRTINNAFFINHQVILFLNKKDVYLNKYKSKPLKNTFPNYEGTTEEDGIKFITTQFLNANKGNPDRITIKICVATDKDSIADSFEQTKKLLADKINIITSSVENKI